MSNSLIERLDCITKEDVTCAATHIMTPATFQEFLSLLRELHQDAIAEIRQLEGGIEECIECGRIVRCE